MTGKLEEDDVAKNWRMGDTLGSADEKAVRKGLEAALCLAISLERFRHQLRRGGSRDSR